VTNHILFIKKSSNYNGQQFHQYQQNEQSYLISNQWYKNILTKLITAKSSGIIAIVISKWSQQDVYTCIYESFILLPLETQLTRWGRLGSLYGFNPATDMLVDWHVKK
jgi:hypothetical protein